MRLRHLLPFLIAALVGLGCQPSTSTESTFNHFSCWASAKPGQDFLQAFFEGPEDSLTPFYRELETLFGKPEVTFLHFSLEDWGEYFDPSRRRIEPKWLASPMGVQKIIVWDSLLLEATGNPVDLSVQVNQKRAGGRMVDRAYCTIEVRVREVDGSSIDWEGGTGITLWQSFQTIIADHFGPPHGPRVDSAWIALSEQYEQQHQEWIQRVTPLLSGECYPPISHESQTGEYRLQICERNDMTDTLYGELIILDSTGHEIPFALVNNLTDSLTRKILIYDGYLSYSFFLREPRPFSEARILLENGSLILIHAPGDFIQDMLPFQFKPPDTRTPAPTTVPEESATIRTL